jgi:hypothetical protein
MTDLTFVTDDGYVLHRHGEHWTDGDHAFRADEQGWPVDADGTPLDGLFRVGDWDSPFQGKDDINRLAGGALSYLVRRHGGSIDKNNLGKVVGTLANMMEARLANVGRKGCQDAGVNLLLAQLSACRRESAKQRSHIKSLTARMKQHGVPFGPPEG